jgi:3-methyladenine DNA glycosylase/8-oxoguanine DNA glycosylase
MVESGRLQIISDTQEISLENEYCGSFALPHSLSPSKRSPIPPGPFFTPDSFDANLVWRRSITIEHNIVALAVSPDGVVSWRSQNPVQSDCVRKKLSLLLVPLPLPTAVDAVLPANIADFFRLRAPLVHIASETLWEALVKGIIRQVITASQAKKVLHRFITWFGEKTDYDGDLYYTFPTPKAIIHTSFDDLHACGLGFKAKTISHLARIYSEQINLEHTVRTASAEEVLKTLQAIKGIGDWTARVACCDLTARWEIHPYDQAVRYWTRHCLAAVTPAWETQEKAFQAQFYTSFGPYAKEVVAYLLAYGPLLR